MRTNKDTYYVKPGPDNNNSVHKVHIEKIKTIDYENITENRIDTIVFTGSLIDCYAYIKLIEENYI